VSDPVSDHSMRILAPSGGRRHAGRPSRARTVSNIPVTFKVTAEERHHLGQVAAHAQKPIASVIRDAVNEYVADYDERKVFD